MLEEKQEKLFFPRQDIFLKGKQVSFDCDCQGPKDASHAKPFCHMFVYTAYYNFII